MNRTKILSELSAFFSSTGTAFVGLGNRDRGDDSIGLVMIDDLKPLSPERFFSEEQGLESVILRLLEEDGISDIVFIDACDLESSPGDISLLNSGEIDQIMISTHKIPVVLLMALLEKNGKNAYLLGIQPRSMNFGEGLSEELRNTMTELEDLFRSTS